MASARTGVAGGGGRAVPDGGRKAAPAGGFGPARGASKAFSRAYAACGGNGAAQDQPRAARRSGAELALYPLANGALRAGPAGRRGGVEDEIARGARFNRADHPRDAPVDRRTKSGRFGTVGLGSGSSSVGESFSTLAFLPDSPAAFEDGRASSADRNYRVSSCAGML